MDLNTVPEQKMALEHLWCTEQAKMGARTPLCPEPTGQGQDCGAADPARWSQKMGKLRKKSAQRSGRYCQHMEEAEAGGLQF